MLIVKYPRDNDILAKIGVDGWAIRGGGLVGFIDRAGERHDKIRDILQDMDWSCVTYTAPSGTIFMDCLPPEVVDYNPGNRRIHYWDLDQSEIQLINQLLRSPEAQGIPWVSFSRAGVWAPWDSRNWPRPAIHFDSISHAINLLSEDTLRAFWVFANDYEAYVVFTENRHGGIIDGKVDDFLASFLGRLNGRKRE